MKTKTLPGTPFPLGACIQEEGVNFAFHAAWKTALLHIFHPGEESPFLTVSPQEKTDSIWHIFVKDLKPPFAYAIQESIHTPLLLDPYAKTLTSSFAWGQEELYAPKALCLPEKPFDWQGTQKTKRPLQEWVIYEMHVRGFTIHPSSGAIKKGTFLGLIEKIPYLIKLGVNAIELLPIFEFNECENKHTNPKTGKKLTNFWGYSTVNFFSLMQRYASSDTILEFKTLVRELHKHDIAIILDVVYNHTNEGGKQENGGTTLSFKGFDPSSYYLMNQEGDYYNFSGTGNTMNCNNPVTLKLIVDSLSYFAAQMQVDAFRFDLASILTRGEDGKVLADPPVLKALENTSDLKDTILIAEAWDAAGLYQVGSFPGDKNWSEWNGKYRDIVRKFLKGTDNCAGAFANALCGSQDLYRPYSPVRSINFITAHDGYTLHDLVSYQEKHNEENAEQNKDGANDNESWNCGAEGDTLDPNILSLRNRQMKNFAVALFVSLGVPLFPMGDEYGHTRRGNNNPYCQDNELNWFLWDICEKNETFFSFMKNLISFRKQKKALFCREHFLSDKDVIWHGIKPNQPDWSPQSRLVAYTLKDPIGKDCFIAFNAGHEPVSITLPPQKHLKIIDTSASFPNDFIENVKKRPLIEGTYLLPPHSTLVAELNE